MQPHNAHPRTRLRLPIAAFALAVAFAASALAIAPPAHAAGKPIKIGLSITMTGPYSPPAIFELEGYQLAIADINRAGGLLGRPVALVKYDDQGNPSTAVQLYQKLITDDGVNLLVSPYETDLTSAVAPLVNRAKIVMMCLAANTDAFTGRFPYLLHAMTRTSRYMIPVIDLAAAKGYKTVALSVQDTQFPEELAKGIRAEAAAKHLKIVFDESYSPDTTDFSALVLKAGAAHPDVIIGATYLSDAEGIMRAAKAENVNAKMFAFSIGPVEPQFSTGVGTAANGVFGTTLYFPTLKTAGNTEFVKEFTAEFEERARLSRRRRLCEPDGPRRCGAQGRQPRSGKDPRDPSRDEGPHDRRRILLEPHRHPDRLHQLRAAMAERRAAARLAARPADRHAGAAPSGMVS